MPQVSSQVLMLPPTYTPFTNDLQLFLGAWSGGTNCGICGELKRVFVSLNYVEGANHFLYKFGFEGILNLH